MINKDRCLTGLCVWGSVCGTHEEYLTLTHGLHLAYRRVGMGKASRKKAPNSKKVKRPSLSLHIDAFACSATILNSPSPSRKSPSPPGRKARDYISQKAAGLPTTPIGSFPARPFLSPHENRVYGRLGPFSRSRGFRAADRPHLPATTWASPYGAAEPPHLRPHSPLPSGGRAQPSSLAAEAEVAGRRPGLEGAAWVPPPRRAWGYARSPRA